MTDVTAPGSTGTAVSDRSSKTSSILSLAVVGILVIVLADTQGLALIPLVGRLGSDFGLTTTQVGWIISATFLAGAATIPTLLRMGDMLGMRKILLGSLVLGAIGNVICAAAPNGEGVLLTGRIIVGIGGVSTPLMYAIMRAQSRSEREVQRGSGLLTAATGIGGMVGFFVGGVVVHYGGSSRTVFWVTAAFSVVVFAAAYVLIPEITTRTRIPIDVVGMFLVAVGLFSVVLGVSKGNAWGWTSGLTLTLLLGGLGMLVVFCVWELNAKHPMVNLRVIANRRVLPPMIGAAFIGGFAIYADLSTSGYVQTPSAVGYGFSATVLTACFYLVPITIFIVISGALAQQVIQRIGVRPTAALGAAIVAAACFWMAGNHSEPWHYVVGLSFYGLGFGFAYAALYAMYLSGARLGESGLVTGAGMLVLTAAASIGTTLFTVILTSRVTIVSQHPLVAVPDARNYTLLWVVPGILGIVVIGLVLITKQIKFRQELAEDTVIREQSAGRL